VGSEMCIRDRGMVFQHMVVRRLTPIECERLQGFPDLWTKIPYRKKDEDKCPDGPRYKSLGNSMATNVMRWIGQRVAMKDGGQI
jgi:DNA (cytosine-5)-methyltransferase 1